MKARIRERIEHRRKLLSTQVFFYVIRLFPRDLRRYKIGFTSNLSYRLKQMYKLCPDLSIERLYKVERYEEYDILQLLRNEPFVVNIGGEIFDADPDKLREFCDIWIGKDRELNIF